MPHGKYPIADQGKCRFCGFLSKHAVKPTNSPAPRFYELEHSERQNASLMESYTGVGVGHIVTEPTCFMGEINLQETREQEGDEALVRKILEDQRCKAWFPYMPGLSPMEHYQQMTMRSFSQALEGERAMRERSYHKQNTFLVVAGLIIGMAQIVAAFILSYHESFTDKVLKSILGVR